MKAFTCAFNVSGIIVCWGTIFATTKRSARSALSIESMRLPSRAGMPVSMVSTSLVPIIKRMMFGLYIVICAGKNGEIPMRPAALSMLYPEYPLLARGNGLLSMVAGPLVSAPTNVSDFMSTFAR